MNSTYKKGHSHLGWFFVRDKWRVCPFLPIMLLSISYYHMTKSQFNALLCSLDSNVIHSCFLLDFQFHDFWFTSSTFTSIFLSLNLGRDFPGGASGKESVCQCRRQKEMQDWSLDQEDLPEEGMAAHSSILAWRIPWTEEPVGLQSRVHRASDTTGQLSAALYRAVFLALTPR